jgi:DNA helicase-2/ATP-dependent DNA helicase PcrA
VTRSVEALVAELNPQQAEAVRTINGALLVLAGAGTGKTKVITTRIAWMIHSGITPESIVAVSFTNKAAREMRERLSDFIGHEIASRVELSTFHSFALKILRENAKAFGLPRKFSIADENQSKTILRETLKELNLQDLVPLQTAEAKIGYFKDQLYTPNDFGKRDRMFDAAILRNLFDGYNRRLRLYSLVDFDDLVYLAVLGLRNNPEVLAKVQQRYRYLMVDEYQDTNNAQFEFIRLLAAERGNVCVVGDDDQSIYSWRGAKGDVLFLFLETFKGAKRISLEQNYRCTQRILDAANGVISENTKRLPKKLWSDKSNTFPIRLHAAENERDEASFVADTILELCGSHPGLQRHDIAILIRASEQAVAIEQVFAERGVAYHVHGGTRFLDRHEVRLLFGYLRLANNPNDLNALFSIINVPARGIGTAALEKVKDAYTAAGDKSAVDVLRSIAHEHRGYADFCTRWDSVGHKITNATNLQEVANALEEAIQTMGLRDEIYKHAKDMQEARGKMDMLERVLDVITALELREFSLDAIADALHLNDVAPREKSKDTTGKVQVMTIHAAKGLEFFAVFIIGAEDGILPHERSIEESGGVDEERRLFYVAITRAKQRLFISHCGFRSRGRGPTRDRERTQSRFLSAIPQTLLQSTEADEESAEARKMASAKRLFELFR